MVDCVVGFVTRIVRAHDFGIADDEVVAHGIRGSAIYIRITWSPRIHSDDSSGVIVNCADSYGFSAKGNVEVVAIGIHGIGCLWH